MTTKVLTVSVSQAGEMIGIGRTAIYECLSQNRLTRCKLGRRTLITVESIERLIASSVVSSGEA